MSKARIQKEIKDFAKNTEENFSASPTEDSIFKWTGMIKGPKDTPYEGGTFKLNIRLPSEYPYQPPKIKFVTKIYHCNIDANGEICLDILKDGWSPALTIEKTLMSLIALLEFPNPDDPLRPDVARELREDGLKFLTKAKEETAKYALPSN